MVKGAWDYKHFIYSSIKAEINGRYSSSKLGGIWLVLHPLAQSLVLAVVLSQLMGSRLSGIESDYAYAVYLLSGSLAWSLFAETSNSALTMFKSKANLIKKISFPRVCIPLIVIGTALFNHLILMIVTLFIVWGLGIAPSSSLVILPFILLINLGLAVGIGMILSVFDVFLRDIGHLWQIIINFWFWLTPIVYILDTLPPAVKGLMEYNPMYWVVNGYQQAIGYKNIVSLEPFIILSCLVALLLSLGFFLFTRASSDIVDAL